MQKIVLLRHAKVVFKEDGKISAHQFTNFIDEYDSSEIEPDFPSKSEVKRLLDKADILICSSLKRSIESLEVFHKTPYKIDSIFDEAGLPYLNWNFLKLSPKIWALFFRLLWLVGYSHDCESLKETKLRAKKAAKFLSELSKDDTTTVLIGHGVFNRFIAKELTFMGWSQEKRLGTKNWDYGIFKL